MFPTSNIICYFWNTEKQKQPFLIFNTAQKGPQLSLASCGDFLRKILAAFTKWDKDANGFISKEELKDVFLETDFERPLFTSFDCT